MGCLVSCLACEAISCCGKGICKCCRFSFPGGRYVGRIMYAVMFFLFSCIAWVLRTWGKQLLHKVPVLQICDGEQGESICFGTLAVYRVSFCLAVFHIVMCLLTIGVKTRGDFRNTVQDGFWLIKISVVFFAIIGTFFATNEVFEYYGWVALFVSGFFILIQLIYIIDFAHSWAENWIEKMDNHAEEGANPWWWILLSTSVFLYIVGFAVTVVMYVYFGSDESQCGKNIAFITINLSLCLVFSFISIHPKIQEYNPRSGLLQASLIFGYTTYLVWSANMSDDSSCNPWRTSDQSLDFSSTATISLIIGSSFTILAVCYSVVSAALKKDDLRHSEEKASLIEESSKSIDEDGTINNEQKVNSKEPLDYNLSRYHLIFAMGAMYISMLMTDWSTVYNLAEDNAQIDSGLAAFWVKVVSSWMCAILFIWTLSGPVLFKDREWK